MISIRYVNNTLTPMTDAFFESYNAEMDAINKEMDFICYEMTLVEEKVNIEQEITGSVNGALMLEYEEKKKNFFQKIGEAIITIFEKIRAAIQTAIDKVKEIAFGSKSDLQKLDTLIKKHPELRDEVVCAFNSGALDMKDVKSLKELDAAFEEVMRMSKEKDIDPNTLKGKWEKAKKKFNEDEKSWNVSKVANVTKTVLTAASAVLTFGAVLKKNKDYLEKSHRENKELEAELEKILRDEEALYKKDKNGNVIMKDGEKVTVGKYTTLLQIARERNGCHDAARMKNLSLLEHIQNGVAKFLDKFTPKSQTDKLYNDYETERKLNADKKQKEYDAEVSKAFDIETSKQKAQKPFKDNDYAQRRKDQQADKNEERQYREKISDSEYKQRRKDQADDYAQRRKDQLADRDEERRYRQRIDARKREQDKQDKEDSQKITSQNYQKKINDTYLSMMVKKRAQERVDNTP